MLDQDRQELARLARRDPAAQGRFVAEHLGPVRRFTQALLGHDGADDAAQETFVRALATLSQFDPTRAKIRSWLFGIARHVSYEQARLRTRERATEDMEVPLVALALSAGWGQPEAAYARAEQRENLAQAIASLTPLDREVIVLRELEGLSNDEVASILGVDLPNLKSRLHRARLRLVAEVRSIEQGVAEQERSVGGMKCSDVLNVLSDYMDGDLGATDRARVENHLRGCGVCERFGGHFTGAVHTVRERLGVAEAPPLELVQHIRAKLG